MYFTRKWLSNLKNIQSSVRFQSKWNNSSKGTLINDEFISMWILMINNIKRTLLALHQTQKGASIFQGDVQKSRQLSNHMPASPRFTHPWGFIHPDYHQAMNVSLLGLGSCDGDVWRPLIAGMAWAMTSANSFIAGPLGGTGSHYSGFYGLNNGRP